MSDRGVIKYVARAQQINDFSGMLLGKITPTDIDAVIEYQDKAYIFIEIKYKDKDLPYGQRLALERLANDTIKAGKKSIVLVAEHEVENTHQSVDTAQCRIRKYYFNNQWHIPKETITVIDAVYKFLNINKLPDDIYQEPTVSSEEILTDDVALVNN